MLDGSAISGSSVERAFYYDYKGRVIQTVEKNRMGGVSRYSTEYDFVGNVLASHESHESALNAQPDVKLTECTYDHRGRLLSETTALNGGTPAVVTYGYDELGRLTTTTYGTGTGAVTETSDYNIQGWLTERSSSLFEMTLRYHNPVKSTSSPSYTGNIAEWVWTHKGTGADNTANTYSFAYDYLSRLTDSRRFVGTSTTPTNAFSERGLTYDKNGNILTLKRYGTSTTTPVDDLTDATYNGNQLSSIKNNGTTRTYGYDSNGNMTLDGLNALQLEYNFLNLTGEVSDSSGDPLATYTWLADGTKVGVVDDDGHGLEYTGSLIYRRNGNTLELESTSFGGGRIEVSEGTSGNIYTPNYFLTDHLGSTRAVVTPNGTVRERNDYHPFGLRWSNSGTQISDNRFRFSGKENQTTGNLPYQDFGARFFGGKLPIFTTPDPRAIDYYPISLYAYVANNPVKHTDPNGKWIVGTDGKKVTYSPDKGWSKNASPDVQRIGNAMLKINIGTERLNFMLNTDEKVSLSISPEIRTGENGSRINGIDSKYIVASPDGSVVTEHEITIYEGSINEHYEKRDYLYTTGIDKEDAIGVIGVHESGHVDKENTQMAIDKKPETVIESNPRALERQAVGEYKELLKEEQS